MNILPKKRWHVRTKDNIARVRRDEAEAREKEQQRENKLIFAESEARINFLRKQSGVPERQAATPVEPEADIQAAADANQHFDLFSDYRSHTKAANKELAKEKKEEQEKYEKQIGYLTYLGQDTNEALKLRSWYEVAPKRAIVGDEPERNHCSEKDLKNKHSQDPLTFINSFILPEKLPERKRKRSVTPPSLTGSTTVSTKCQQLDQVPQKAKKSKKHKADRSDEKDLSTRKTEKKSKKSKKRKHKDAERRQLELNKKDKLDKLRKERLRRERVEQLRQESLLAPKPVHTELSAAASAPTPKVVQKYNSQFNPELAKQNMM